MKSLMSMILESELETHFIDGRAVRAVKPYEGDLTENEINELFKAIEDNRFHGILKTERNGEKIHVIWNRSITFKGGR